jgi:putative membrane protein
VVIVIDLVLDPSAVAVSFWSYENGFYYGVPVSNYLGWVLSSAVAVFVFDRAFELEKVIDRLEDCVYLLDDMVSFVILWTVVCLFYNLWIPAFIGLTIGYILYRFEKFDIPAPKWIKKEKR